MQEVLTSVTCPEIGFDGGMRLTVGQSRTDGIRSHSGRNHERLCVMHRERWKRLRRAFHDRAVSLDKIQDVEVSMRVMRHGSGKPMAPRLNKLQQMQASSFFAPAFARCDIRFLINQVLAHPGGGSIPLDVSEAVL